MTATPQLAAQRPTLEQMDRIRQLSNVVLNDPSAAFTAYGYPSTRIDASQLIKRLDGMRTHDDPADIEIPEPKEEEPMPDEGPKKMHCTRCDTDKPVSDFSPSVQTKGSGWCRACFRDYSREKTRADRVGGKTQTPKSEKKNRRLKTPTRGTTTTSTPGTTGSSPAVVGPVSEPDPPLSSNGEWRARLEDPTLSRLTWIQEALGIPTLDETAEVCRLIAGQPDG